MMKQYISTVFLLLVASALVSGDQGPQESGVKRELKPEEWLPLVEKVYVTDGEKVEHAKVLEILKELQKIFEPFGEEETNSQKSKINQLIEVSVRDVEKCSRSQLEKIHDLIDENIRFTNSIFPYLNHHFEEYVSFCEKHVLHTNVAGIKEEHRTGIQELSKLLTKVEVEVDDKAVGELKQVPLGTYKWDHLENGILTFMRLYGSGKSDIDSSSKFASLFDTQIMNMCRSWIEATDPARAMNQYFIRIQFDVDEKNWLKYGALCHTIEVNESVLVPRLYSLFKKLNSTPRFKGLRSKLKKLVSSGKKGFVTE